MDEQILQRLNEQSAKIDAIFNSVEKTRKYFLITMWTSIILFVLPLIAMVFVIPMFLSSYLGSFNGLL